jgi:hypothetical protein
MNYFNELSQLMHDFPELVFDNQGYQRLSKDVISRNQVGFDKVSEILKVTVSNFVEFQNFKPQNNGTFALRMQTRWDERFTGVEYISLDNFKPDSGTWA